MDPHLYEAVGSWEQWALGNGEATASPIGPMLSSPFAHVHINQYDGSCLWGGLFIQHTN